MNSSFSGRSQKVSKLEYLKSQCVAQFREVSAEDGLPGFVYVDLCALSKKFSSLYEDLLENAHFEVELWNKAALQAHKSLNPGATSEVRVRFFNNPVTETVFPSFLDSEKFVQVEGTIKSLSKKAYVQGAKEFSCSKCHEVCLVRAQYETYFEIRTPSVCPDENCDGQLILRSTSHALTQHLKFYQEVYLDEISPVDKKLRTLIVTIEDEDLSEVVQLGVQVTVVGVVTNRQKQVAIGKVAKNHFPLRANNVWRKEKQTNSLNSEEMRSAFAQWNGLLKQKGEIGARDFLLQSFLPEIYCMFVPKLAVALSMASCVEYDTYRNHSHVLLLGKPGVAKSKLLERANELAPKSFFAAGYRASRAGLTAGVVKIHGTDTYEAGILPLSDGGLCCIDEFNMLKEHDKGALLEAMEQQTVSLIKAGMTAKLRSRCVIIAAANPKDRKRFKQISIERNIGIPPALLSRFDTVLILNDIREPDFDRRLTRHVMACKTGRLQEGYFWSTEQLKQHFLAALDVKPEVTAEAKEVLNAYFQRILTFEEVAASRTTQRALDASFRLAKAYCRLLLKPRVQALDAIIVIRLILENCYEMGKLVAAQFDTVQKSLPLGPTEEEIKELMHNIGLFDLIPTVMQQLQDALTPGLNTVDLDESIGPKFPANAGPNEWASLLTSQKTGIINSVTQRPRFQQPSTSRAQFSPPPRFPKVERVSPPPTQASDLPDTDFQSTQDLLQEVMQFICEDLPQTPEPGRAQEVLESQKENALSQEEHVWNQIDPKEPAFAQNKPDVRPKETIFRPKESVFSPKEPVVSQKEPPVIPKVTQNDADLSDEELLMEILEDQFEEVMKRPPKKKAHQEQPSQEPPPSAQTLQPTLSDNLRSLHNQFAFSQVLNRRKEERTEEVSQLDKTLSLKDLVDESFFDDD